MTYLVDIQNNVIMFSHLLTLLVYKNLQITYLKTQNLTFIYIII